jgi:hypothetical protein
MPESIIISEQVKRQFSARATLVAIGAKVRAKGLFEPVAKRVRIAQKKVKHSPTEKLQDAYINILAGGHGMVEVNKRVRSDRALQLAFGRDGCAEQSVVQETLDACTEENVAQMHQAMQEIYRQHSSGYRHNYQEKWQLLDADLTGRPCGKKATLAEKRYFARQRNRRGRQVGYVVATLYDEIVVERVYAGKMQLSQALPGLIEETEQTLDLDEVQRQRTIWRVDAGGGSVDDVNYALERGYQFHGKDYSASRVETLMEGVEWVTDPKDSNRQFGWVTVPCDLYVRPVRRIAVRCRKKNGQWRRTVLLSTLLPEWVLGLTEQPSECLQDPLAVLCAYVYLYDQRGGGVETEIKEDKQGLGTKNRNKKRFEAQQMVVQLEALAHNTLVWVRRWLSSYCPRIRSWGMLRLVRDLCHMTGLILFDHAGHIRQIVLNQADPVARESSFGLASILAREQIAVILGETWVVTTLVVSLRPNALIFPQMRTP